MTLLDGIVDLDLDASLDVQEEDLALDLDWGLDAFLAVNLWYDLGCETGLILDQDTDMETFVGDRDTALDINEWTGWISKSEFRELD